MQTIKASHGLCCKNQRDVWYLSSQHAHIKKQKDVIYHLDLGGIMGLVGLVHIEHGCTSKPRPIAAWCNAQLCKVFALCDHRGRSHTTRSFEVPWWRQASMPFPVSFHPPLNLSLSMQTGPFVTWIHWKRSGGWEASENTNITWIARGRLKTGNRRRRIRNQFKLFWSLPLWNPYEMSTSIICYEQTLHAWLVCYCRWRLEFGVGIIRLKCLQKTGLSVGRVAPFQPC